MHDIPIADAVIVATRGRGGVPAVVTVLRHADPAITGYDFTTGAGEDRWDNNPDLRLFFLYETMWFLAHVRRIRTDAIHAAMQMIPEYRNLEGNEVPESSVAAR